MLDLKRNYSVSNVDFTKETVALNQLDVNNCLFTPELLAALLKCPVKCSKSQSQVIKNKDGIYLIVFRVLNNEKKSLIYNYIYYNDLLYLTLIVYFLTRNYFITENNHEWGKYLVILDNKFLDYTNVSNYINIYNTKEKLRH
jgi:hypothetical protein